MVPRNGALARRPDQGATVVGDGCGRRRASKSGYQKIVDIMEGDQQLAEGKGGREGAKAVGRDRTFGADLYYLAIFGKPSATEPWMVQFGGHHLGVNVTVIGKHFGSTPTHTGQPALFAQR